VGFEIKFSERVEGVSEAEVLNLGRNGKRAKTIFDLYIMDLSGRDRNKYFEKSDFRALMC